jgi:lipopolysaccharide export system permease protein
VILRNYLIRESLISIGAVLIVFIFIYGSARFAHYLADAAAGKLPGHLIASMLMLEQLAFSPLTLPLCFSVGLILALGRLQQDRELVVMAGAGAGRPMVIRWLSGFIAAMVCLTGFLGLGAAPWARREIRELEARARVESDITGVGAGRFKEFSNGDRVIYVEEMADDRKSMSKVFVQNKEGQRVELVNAASAKLEVDEKTGDRFAAFSNGTRYDGAPGKLDYDVTQYAKYAVRIEFNAPTEAAQDIDAMPLWLLWTLGKPPHLAELQWRLAPPIVTLLLGLLAIMIATWNTRGGRYGAALVGVLAYFAYSNFLGVAKQLTKRGDIPAYLGLWWVHVLMAVVVGALLALPFLRRWRAERTRAVLTVD